MAQKKDNLPVNADVELQNGGTITYANEVIAIIAGVAANEIDGIAGMCISGGFTDIIGRNRNITRGVKVEIGSEEASVDLYTIVEYGKPIQKVCSEVQENVRKAIESMTGLHVVKVDVHVQGVSFEKEKKATQKGIEAANTPVLAQPEAPAAEPVEEPVAVPTQAEVEEMRTEAEEQLEQELQIEMAADEAEVTEEAACCCDECAECAEEPVAEEAPEEIAAEEAPIEAPAEDASKQRRNRKQQARD